MGFPAAQGSMAVLTIISISGDSTAALNLTYAFGFYVYSGSKAGTRDQRWWNNSVEVYETAWKQPGDITNIPRPVMNDNVSNGSAFAITENIEKGDYLKIRNISAWIHIQEYPSRYAEYRKDQGLRTGVQCLRLHQVLRF
jgi:hypothetical protein